MFVYRVTDELEINTILNEHSLDNIGRECVNDEKRNNHKYKTGKKYMHFYATYGSIFYYNSQDRRYICTYDIPDDVLEQSKGTGYYLDLEFFEHLQEVTEYAVEIDLLDFSYLKKVEEMSELLLFEDYIYNEHQDKLKTIYEADQKVLKK